MKSSCAFLFISLLLLFSACTEESTPTVLQSLPVAYGKINQVVVVADEEVWEGAVGDSLDYHLAGPFLLLPRPEPIFDLIHYTPEELQKDPVRKQMRNYVFVADLSDEDSPTTQMVISQLGPERIRKIRAGKGYGIAAWEGDKWAKGQLFVYMYGLGADKLIRNIQENSDAVIQRIKKHERPRIEATAYQAGEHEELITEIQDKFGIYLRVPKDYFKAVYDPDNHFMWIRKETKELSSNILIHKRPYTSTEQFSKEGLKRIRDELGRKYISTRIENTYMRIDDVHLPLIVTPRRVNNVPALEARGIWEIVNDYMGGPFISLLMVNPKTNEIIFLDGFIWAPGEDHRDYLEQLEVILNTVKF